MKKSNPGMKTIGFLLALLTLTLILIIVVLLNEPAHVDEGVNKFTSFAELEKFVEDNKISSKDYGWILKGATYGLQASGTSTSGIEAESAGDYSTTNIQVEGVDEADILKNDGKYIYVVSDDRVIIVDAYPADDMEIISEINMSNVEEIYINEDKLIAFSRDYSPFLYGDLRCGANEKCLPPNYNEQKTLVYIYDIKERDYPKLQEKITVSGNYINSRMIGDYVYVIANQHVYEDIILPAIEENGKVDVVKPEEIYYPDIRDYNFQFMIILAIDIDSGETSREVTLAGNSQNIYVSEDNIYTTYPIYSSWYSNIADDNKEKTIINKISVDKDEIEYKARGEVPGHILNQFSMDEYDNNFRIATTVGGVWNSEEKSQNNVYVLDSELNIIGELENLAPGEKIYSARFMGGRGYVVTFKKVDPLFVIDLSDPKNPDVLGKLKVPGYSDYLHPIDEDHIIGIGKDTVEAADELKEQRQLDFAWYQGVKMAVFDVSDVENPVELHKEVIGDRGTDSEALHNHKAFLFDRKKELLVIPITLAEIKGEKTSDNQHGEITFQGAFVYNLNIEDGFELKGRVTHYDEDEVEKKSGYYWYGDRDIRRSLYMDDVLYTFSESTLKANDLDNLKEISSVEL